YLDRTDLAHVEPEGARFDTLGGGVTEGTDQRSGEEAPQTPAIEMLRKMASSGFHRKRLPKEFLVLNGGAGAAAASTEVAAAISTTSPAAGVTSVSAGVATTTSAAVAIDRRMEARMKGYEGDACGECGNFTLVRNGTCMKCDSCGATSGCS
ncbi:MAG TPA: vitamin B12-dependent ribonucleotide reductase, partial [Paracoccaceae bacterium]|nr:vitamin B12-dependent ribonucleotide reductase [Paracoccaceae bacterium]